MGSVTNGKIFELLQKTSHSVEDIKQELTSFKLDLSELKNTVETLEAENIKLKQKIAFHDEILKRKNILVFGLSEEETVPLKEVLLDVFSNRLGVRIKIADLDNFFRIGEKKNGKCRPVLVKFLSGLSKQDVLKNAKKLKNSGISVTQDLTQERRAENKILYEFLNLAKSKQFSAKIRKNKLVVNNQEYTVDALKALNKAEFLEPIVNKQSLFRNSSAPSTPTTKEQHEDYFEDDVGDESRVFDEESGIESPQQHVVGVTEGGGPSSRDRKIRERQGNRDLLLTLKPSNGRVTRLTSANNPQQRKGCLQKD